jgi:hypothetical protein
MLENHCRFAMDTTPLLENAHRDGSNTKVKVYITTSKRCHMSLKQ